MSDTTLGMIVVAALLAGALLVNTLGLVKPSRKEVADEARKRLVGKFAEEKATAQFEAIKKGGSIGGILLTALLLAGIGYVIVSNMDRGSGTQPPATTISATAVPPAQSTP